MSGVSDTAALHGLVAEMIAAGEVHAMRDPTRGGLGAMLVEIAAAPSAEATPRPPRYRYNLNVREDLHGQG
jgi:phosphoribosylformylglycinamidine (FGAM) synthase-like enzyme